MYVFRAYLFLLLALVLCMIRSCLFGIIVSVYVCVCQYERVYVCTSIRACPFLPLAFLSCTFIVCTYKSFFQCICIVSACYDSLTWQHAHASDTSSRNCAPTPSFFLNFAMHPRSLVSSTPTFPLFLSKSLSESLPPARF